MLHPWPIRTPVIISDCGKTGTIVTYYGALVIVKLDNEHQFYSEDRTVFTRMMVVHSSNLKEVTAS